MGYITSYKLEWEAQEGYTRPRDPLAEEVRQLMGDKADEVIALMNRPAIDLDSVIGDYISRDTDNEWMSAMLDRDGSTGESGKWYEHEEDMREMSLAFPEVLFTLSGEGEDNEDIWKKYFLNGKMQVEKAKIQIAPFDPEKLR